MIWGNLWFGSIYDNLKWNVVALNWNWITLCSVLPHFRASSNMLLVVHLEICLAVFVGFRVFFRQWCLRFVVSSILCLASNYVLTSSKLIARCRIYDLVVRCNLSSIVLTHTPCRHCLNNAGRRLARSGLVSTADWPSVCLKIVAFSNVVEYGVYGSHDHQ